MVHITTKQVSAAKPRGPGILPATRKLCFLLLTWFVSLPTYAVLNVVSCEPEWGALVEEIAGSKVKVRIAAQAMQDPHYIQARPSLVAAVRNADLVICTGAELEASWLPVLLRTAGNPAVQPGQPGYLEAASIVPLVDIPTQLDRSHGDIHASGNPHIQYDPHLFIPIARELSKRLIIIDAQNAAHYQKRTKDFLERWQTAVKRWDSIGAKLKGTPVVTFHNQFPYLSRWLGLKEIAHLEPKPGVAPSAAHLSQVLATLRTQPAQMIIRSPYDPEQATSWLSKRAQIPIVTLPGTVGGSKRAKDLFGLFDDTLEQLLSAIP